MTLLQLARAFAALANGARLEHAEDARYAKYVVRALLDASRTRANPRAPVP